MFTGKRSLCFDKQLEKTTADPHMRFVVWGRRGGNLGALSKLFLQSILRHRGRALIGQTPTRQHFNLRVKPSDESGLLFWLPRANIRRQWARKNSWHFWNVCWHKNGAKNLGGGGGDWPTSDVLKTLRMYVSACLTFRFLCGDSMKFRPICLEP